MNNPLSRYHWFIDLAIAANIGQQTLEDAISQLTMRRLSKMGVGNILEMAIMENGQSLCFRSAAASLSLRLAICGLIEPRDLAGYRRRKDASKWLLRKIDEKLALVRQSRKGR